MNTQFEEDQDAVEQSSSDIAVLSAMSRAEIDSQITTARAYPRSIKRFMNEALQMVTLTEAIADSCIYAVPRKEKGQTKMIEGPSARFAEVVAHSWGNCRAGARVVAEEQDFVVAQGVFHDLEKNTVITYEVKRSIKGKYGRFTNDMIGVTGNAACSIALRNAVLKGVPKSFWLNLYEEARRTAIGDAKTLANKRSDMLAYFQKLGVNDAMILDKLGKKGIEDIGLDELAQLKGLATAIKEGDTTIEQVFNPEAEGRSESTKDLGEKLKKRGAKETSPPSAVDTTTGEITDTAEAVLAAMKAATTRDELDAAADRISLVPKPERAALVESYNDELARIEQGAG